MAAKHRPGIPQHRSAPRIILQHHTGQTNLRLNNGVRRPSAMHVPPANTRASGRARAVSFFQNCNFPYVINWDSIACDSRDFLVMVTPLKLYNDEVDRFLSKPRVITSATEQQL